MADMDMVGVTIARAEHTVLVVDDNPATRYSTARTLRAAGFKTVEAATGTEALEKSEGNISAIVLDVHLPDIGGFEVCRILRGKPTTAVLPVVHLSATYVEDKHKIAGLNSGADAYLTHPAEPPILIATVQALVRARAAEDLLRKSEAKFRAIYTEADTGIALVDADGAIVEANPALLRMLGRSAAEVIRRKVLDFAPPQWVPAVRAMAEAQHAGADPRREAFALSLPDGEEVHLEWKMSPHIEPGMRIGVVTNISARMKLERQREELLEREKAARTAAEQHSLTKDNFIAVLSHELRNPLNAILMGLHVLLNRGLPPETVRGLQMIERNAKAQARIISDILDVSRINSGKLTLDRELIDPAAVVTSALDGVKEMLERRRLTVSLDLDSAHEPVWLDATRFQQMFWNIFNNAVKFSELGGTIEASLKREGAALVLTVQDHGKGIESDFLRTIFEKFSQGSTPGNRSHGGLGLGMAIVKHLTDLHGGSVRVDSDGPGKGAKVTLSIPALPGPAHGEDLSVDSARLAPDSNLSGVLILVVEDEPQNREMLTMILRDRGARVITAENYEDAIAQFDRQWPDVLVSDIGLPGRDGYELIAEIRKREARVPSSRRLPSIALTAFGRDEDVHRALDSGFDAHFAKPLRAHDLVSRIDKLVLR
jgi:PAS domain S-box-containing protein